MQIDLSKLPAPAVVEDLGFEAILAEHRADLLARHPEAMEVIGLESEPLNKLLQAHAYRELLYRQRVNEAARATLLAFATGTDLDHKAAFYGLARLDGEGDERLRLRTQLRIAALAANGTAEQYRLAALSASDNVFDAVVTQPTAGGVHVVLWVVDAAQGQTTVNAVTGALNADGARPLGIPLTVGVAVPRPIHITAQLWREASAPTDLVSQIATALPGMLMAYARLGRAVPRSWVTTRLHVAGIARVVYPYELSPAENTPLADDEYPVAGSIDLIDQGTTA